MRTIAVSSRSRALNALLKRDRKENIILRALDGHEFVLAELDDFHREIELTRQNDRRMKLLDRRGREKAAISLAARGAISAASVAHVIEQRRRARYQPPLLDLVLPADPPRS